jgi:imidazolonepropionase-like amidohydrolase
VVVHKAGWREDRLSLFVTRKGISRRGFLKLAAATLLAGGCRRVRSGGTPLALANGRLIDGTGAEPLLDAAVLIEGTRIAAVGSRQRVSIPNEAQVMDVQGATILPGLINAHVHAAYSESTLKAWAAGGVTTVRDLGNGGRRSELFALRDRVQAKPACARLVAAGPMVTVPGGYPIVPWGVSGLTVTSVDDARQKVGALLDDGADVIKVALESGATFGREIPMLSPAEAAAIVALAHERGTVVSAHVTAARDVEVALDAGVDDLAHMVVDGLPDALIERVVEAGVYWVPTLELWDGVSRAQGIDLDRRAVRNLERYVAAGGKVALGTDYAGYDTAFQLGTPMREVELMLQAGMSPLQILVAATRNAAQVCNLGSEIGTLEPGKRADILVVEDDPLQDVQALTQTRWVFRDGVLIS